MKSIILGLALSGVFCLMPRTGHAERTHISEEGLKVKALTQCLDQLERKVSSVSTQENDKLFLQYGKYSGDKGVYAVSRKNGRAFFIKGIDELNEHHDTFGKYCRPVKLGGDVTFLTVDTEYDGMTGKESPKHTFGSKCKKGARVVKAFIETEEISNDAREFVSKQVVDRFTNELFAQLDNFIMLNSYWSVGGWSTREPAHCFKPDKQFSKAFANYKRKVESCKAKLEAAGLSGDEFLKKLDEAAVVALNRQIENAKKFDEMANGGSPSHRTTGYVHLVQPAIEDAKERGKHLHEAPFCTLARERKSRSIRALENKLNKKGKDGAEIK